MRIFFSVGEPSGDQHAAHLVEELRQRDPDIQVTGFGGPLMQRAGVDLLFQLTDLAVMGFVQVLPLIRKFRKLARQAEDYFETHPVDAVVLVDFPGFNWWIACAAKRRGIRVFYYCPPQLWAWAPWRIRKMCRNVDHVLCCHPFEAQWYQERDMPAEYVGHPFYDEIAERQLDLAFLEEQCRASVGQRTLAILPGSRNHEIRHNWPIQVEVMRRLAETQPDVRFLVACYKESQRQTCREHLLKRGLQLPVELWVDRTSEIIELGEACFMVSGSVSLEVLTRGKPAVVLYRVDRLFAYLAKLLVRCRWMSLPNLIAGEELMPEFPLYGAARQGMDDMTHLWQQWLNDPELFAQKQGEMAALKERVARTGGIACAAATILRHLASAESTDQKSASAA